MRQIILNFHGIGVPHAGVPEDEVPYWLSIAQFQGVVDRAKGRTDIAFTFDDGNRSDLEIAAPALEAAGFNGAFFILTGRFGQPEYLTPDDIRTLKAAGHDIGLHGRDHVRWRDIDDDQLLDETENALTELNAIIGNDQRHIAIPFGAYNRRVIAHLKRLPIGKIYTSDGGPTTSARRIQSRTSMRADTTLNDLRHILDDDAGLAKKARRNVSRFLRQNII